MSWDCSEVDWKVELMVVAMAWMLADSMAVEKVHYLGGMKADLKAAMKVHQWAAYSVGYSANHLKFW